MYCILPAVLVTVLAQPNPHVASTEPLSPQQELKTFHLPPGFEAQLVAAEPDIHKPLNIAFDDRGRLWVSQTIEYPFPAPPDRKPRDAVKILDDFGPDGRARNITTFADGLNIPIGVLPLPARASTEALVYSIPSIYRLRDSRGTGQADERQALYSQFETRDTHGMTNSFVMGFDGWIYACHGFSNTSTVKGADNQAISMNSGNTYRMKADGSHLEYFTHGQVNPFGLGFDPLGNLYSADCHSRPIYQLLRGAWYPSFGKPHDGLGFGPEIMTHDHGSTAIAGLVYYAADHFPHDYRDTIFIGNVVTNRINHDRLQRTGSTVKAVGLPDFLRSDDPWFRPVDLKLGPDGALYVADFYNRIIGHYEVPLTHPGRDRERGRIWRIVYKGPDGKNPLQVSRQDWNKATVQELIEDLGHPNLTVRLTATHQLASRRAPATDAVRKVFQERAPAQNEKHSWQRAHALWVLERAKALEEADLLIACQDPSSLVKVHAQRVLAERTELSPALLQAAGERLKDADANVQRAAADALGRHPAASNLRLLLDLRHQISAGDTHLLHVVRMALRDQLRMPDNWARMEGPGWTERDGQAIADVALGVPTAEAAAYLLQTLRQKQVKLDVPATAHHIARYGSPEVTRGLLPVVQQQPNRLMVQANLFRAIDRGTQERSGQLDEATRRWATELTGRLLASTSKPEVQAGIDMVGRLRLLPEQQTLVRLAQSQQTAEEVRRSALDALVAIDLPRNAAIVGRVLMDSETPIVLREHAANVLGRGNQPVTLALLVESLPAAPARLQTVIAAALAGSRPGGETLLGQVEAGKASARLLQERAVEVRLNLSGVPDLKARVEKLTRGLPPADQRIQELLSRRRTAFLASRPDTGLGAKVFEKHCAACHQIANKGARIGPQLDGIGIRGLDRLLEDTLDPNRNVDQAFRTTNLTLKNGQLVSGLLLKEEGDVLVLADQLGKEVRVPKGMVEERSTSQMSPMPANLIDQIPEAEFADLMAFLLSQRPNANGKEGGK